MTREVEVGNAGQELEDDIFSSVAAPASVEGDLTYNEGLFDERSQDSGMESSHSEGDFGFDSDSEESALEAGQDGDSGYESAEGLPANEILKNAPYGEFASGKENDKEIRNSGTPDAEDAYTDDYTDLKALMEEGERNGFSLSSDPLYETLSDGHEIDPEAQEEGYEAEAEDEEFEEFDEVEFASNESESEAEFEYAALSQFKINDSDNETLENFNPASGDQVSEDAKPRKSKKDAGNEVRDIDDGYEGDREDEPEKDYSRLSKFRAGKSAQNAESSSPAEQGAAYSKLGSKNLEEDKNSAGVINDNEGNIYAEIAEIDDEEESYGVIKRTPRKTILDAVSNMDDSSKLMSEFSQMLSQAESESETGAGQVRLQDLSIAKFIPGNRKVPDGQGPDHLSSTFANLMQESKKIGVEIGLEEVRKVFQIFTKCCDLEFDGEERDGQNDNLPYAAERSATFLDLCIQNPDLKHFHGSAQILVDAMAKGLSDALEAKADSEPPELPPRNGKKDLGDAVKDVGEKALFKGAEELFKEISKTSLAAISVGTMAASGLLLVAAILAVAYLAYRMYKNSKSDDKKSSESVFESVRNELLKEMEDSGVSKGRSDKVAKLFDERSKGVLDKYSEKDEKRGKSQDSENEGSKKGFEQEKGSGKSGSPSSISQTVMQRMEQELADVKKKLEDAKFTLAEVASLRSQGGAETPSQDSSLNQSGLEKSNSISQEDKPLQSFEEPAAKNANEVTPSSDGDDVTFGFEGEEVGPQENALTPQGSDLEPVIDSGEEEISVQRVEEAEEERIVSQVLEEDELQQEGGSGQKDSNSSQTFVEGVASVISRNTDNDSRDIDSQDNGLQGADSSNSQDTAEKGGYWQRKVGSNKVKVIERSAGSDGESKGEEAVR